MNILFFLLSVVLVTAGHVCKARRWARLIGVYERPRSWVLLRAMGLGYELSFLLPFKLGDLFRAFYAGRRMKSGIGLSLATVIVDRFGNTAFLQTGSFLSTGEVTRLIGAFLGDSYTETAVLTDIPRDASTRAFPVSSARAIPGTIAGFASLFSV